MVKKFIALLMMGVSVAASAETLDGVMLKYMVSEQGLEPYPSRIIITEKMVRMDDDDEQGNYLLFDREKQLISSVTHEDGTVFEIPQRLPNANPPIPLNRDQKLEADEKAPKIGGRQPHRLRLYVNEKLCFDAVVVPGLLPDSVKALQEFKRVLAGEQGKLLDELPQEMIEGCDLALHTFYPTWMLESGIAIQEVDLSNRKSRLLVDIDQSFKVDDKLFVVPDDYKHYRTP
jgi:hypothetical protein